MNGDLRWHVLRGRASRFLSPAAQAEARWRERLLRSAGRAPTGTAGRTEARRWLALHARWWQTLWGDERRVLAGFRRAAMGIDPQAPPADQARALLDYYRARPFPEHGPRAGRHSSRRLGTLLKAAEAVRAHTFTFLGYPPFCTGSRIAWNADPYGDIEWPTCLQRHSSLKLLADAYAATGREPFARAFRDQFTDWAALNPLQPWTRRAVAWSTLNAAVRAAHWAAALPVVCAARAMTPDAWLLALSALRRNMNFLMTHAKPHGNWLITESVALYRAGVQFHEIRDAARWRREGRRRLEREIMRQFLPDGAHVEYCPGYHAGALDGFYAAAHVARRYLGTWPFSAARRARLRQACRFLALTALPDSCSVPLGDSGRRSVIPCLRQWLELKDDPLLRFVATRGREGAPPAVRDLLFRASGHAVLRDAWRRTRRFLLFDMAPYAPIGSHSHRDGLQVVAWGFGHDLLVDSGVYRYSEPHHTDYGQTRRHNTVEADGRSQDKVRPEVIAWQSSPDLCYAAGMGAFWPGIRHLREIVFLDRTAWLVLDLLASGESHVYRQWWHFGQPLLAPARRDRVRTRNLVLATPAGAAPALSEADAAVAYNCRAPRPAACVTRAGRGIVAFAALIYPVPDGDRPPAASLAIQAWPAAPEAPFRVRVRLPGRDYGFTCSGAWQPGDRVLRR